MIGGPTVPSREDVLAWCADRFGSGVDAVLFEAGYLSRVVGVRLADGREVVAKARPWHPRLPACDLVQRAAHAHGFPCARPIVALEKVDGAAFGAEGHLPGGHPLDPAEPAAAARSAGLLARLVAVPRPDADLSSLGGSLPWVGWDAPTAGLWPARDDAGPPVEEHDGPAWLDEAARAAKDLLRDADLPLVVGHGDWHSGNVGWRSDGAPLAVHDWDSAVLQPEAAVAGAASAVWPVGVGDILGATVGQSALFLDGYQRATRRFWTVEETHVAWAAGLWIRAFDAKKDAADGGGPLVGLLAREVDERLARAGLAA